MEPGEGRGREGLQSDRTLVGYNAIASALQSSHFQQEISCDFMRFSGSTWKLATLFITENYKLIFGRV